MNTFLCFREKMLCPDRIVPCTVYSCLQTGQILNGSYQIRRQPAHLCGNVADLLLFLPLLLLQIGTLYLEEERKEGILRQPVSTVKLLKIPGRNLCHVEKHIAPPVDSKAFQPWGTVKLFKHIGIIKVLPDSKGLPGEKPGDGISFYRSSSLPHDTIFLPGKALFV
jgi:hypothetical protein